MHDHPLLQQLGATVRSLRTARRWTRRDLAAHTGISERFLADVEGGTANPSLLKVLDLAKAFEVRLVDLLGGAGDVLPAGRTRHVALLGLRGAGKSTVGPLVAARLGRAFVELDARIEAATGLQLGELFVLHGENYYRQAERTALDQLLGEDRPGVVVAVGGGLVAEPSTFALLRTRTTTVWLRAEPKDHWQRVLAQGDTRPMADNDRAFTDLRRILAAREPFYRLADVVVQTSDRPVAAIVDEVVQQLLALERQANGEGSAT